MGKDFECRVVHSKTGGWIGLVGRERVSLDEVAQGLRGSGTS